MSFDAIRWAMPQRLEPSQKLVLLVLANFAGPNHECWPSTKLLVELTGLYRETIYSATEQLEARGLLRIKRKRGAVNRYQLLGVDIEKQSAKADQSENPDTGSRQNPTRTSRQKPTLNLLKNQSINQYGNTAFDRLNDRSWAEHLVGENHE